MIRQAKNELDDVLGPDHAPKLTALGKSASWAHNARA